MNRVLEPELMTDPDQANAYAAADFATVNQSFVDRFRALFPDFARGRMVDLGGGPADIPIRFCRALPAVTVTGVDGSEAMLAPALIMDLHRPDSLERARAIVETHSAGEPEVLQRDFFHSLCAAFTLDEVRAQITKAGLDRLRCEMASNRHWVAWGRLE